MAKKSKNNLSLEKFINENARFIRIDRDLYNNCLLYRKQLLDFCDRVEKNEEITANELKVAQKRIAHICGMMGEYLTTLYKDKEAIQEEIIRYFVPIYKVCDPRINLIFIGDRNALVNETIIDADDFIRRMINYFDCFVDDFKYLYDSYDKFESTFNLFIEAIQSRVMIDEEKANLLVEIIKTLEPVNPSNSKFDVNELIYSYNKNILDFKMQQKQAELRALAKAKEEENKVVEKDPYEERIIELETYPDKTYLDTIPNLDKNMVIDNLSLPYKITVNDVKELDMIVCQPKIGVYNTFISFGDAKRKLFYTLLFRTYINKKMDQEIKDLANMIPDIEMKKFNFVKFLSAHENMANDLVLYNNYRNFAFEVSKNNNYENQKLLNRLNEQIEAFENIIYFYATGVYNESDYLSELKEHLIFYESIAASYGFDSDGIEQASDLLDSNNENIIVLLTDDNNVSYAEKDMLAEIDNQSDMSIVYNQLVGIKDINVHEVDPHKFKTDYYSEDFLKNLHFKSLKKVKTRFFFGKFANSNRESMVIIYGVHHGAMDNNRKTEYGNSALKNCTTEIDKINMIVDAFANRSVDPKRFDEILNNSDEALKRIEKLANGEGLKLK